jgi:hypothetical protein
MVIDLKAINKVTRILEAYFIHKNGYRLSGASYDLILLIPAESSGVVKYSWIISSRLFLVMPETTIVSELFTMIKGALSSEEFATIARINVIQYNNPFVRNVNFVVPGDSEMVQFNNQNIGGVDLNQAILIRSNFLKKAKEGSAVTFVVTNNRKVNAGIISIDKKFKIKHYTRKGLDEIFGQRLPNFNVQRANDLKLKSETYLIQHEYIGFTEMKDIKAVI